MRYELKKLSGRHIKVLELYLDGKTRRDIAKEVGLSPRMVTNITSSKVFLEEYVKRLAERNQRMDRQYAQGVLPSASGEFCRILGSRGSRLRPNKEVR